MRTRWLTPGDIEDIASKNSTQDPQIASLMIIKKNRKTEKKIARVILKANGNKCTECGKKIPKKRRKALPGTTLCVICAEKKEREEKMRR